MQRRTLENQTVLINRTLVWSVTKRLLVSFAKGLTIRIVMGAGRGIFEPQEFFFIMKLYV